MLSGAGMVNLAMCVPGLQTIKTLRGDEYIRVAGPCRRNPGEGDGSRLTCF
jgi:hypothetical protein